MTTRLRERLGRQPPGYEYTIGRILAIYSGLMVTLLLAALDQTIVATALPQVVGDLGGITQYSWVFTAYMLTSTVTVPLYGKLGDAYGRKNLFLFAIVVFLLGSALCGLATSMTQLVVFRGIQGIGGGGVFPLSLAVIGNIVPPRDRGRWQGLIGAVFAASSIIGPAIGGFIVDNASWRWVFLVNLPIGGLALVVVSLTMPRRARVTQHSIDWLGAALLAAGTAALLMGLVWGGSQYSWSSAHVVGAFVGRRRLARRVRARRAPSARADSAVRHPPQPDRRRQRRLHGPRRNGDVRDDLVRPALRAGRDRHLGDVLGGRADAAPAQRGHYVAAHGPARLAHRPLPLERGPRPGRPEHRHVPAVADGHDDDERRGSAEHGRRRNRDRLDDAGVRAVGSERRSSAP